MASFVKVISSEFDKIKRRVIKALRKGNGDIQTSDEVAPYGIDSNPIKDMVAIYVETGMNGETAIVGYINKNQLAKPGEMRIYSTNSTGVLKAYVWLKDDGTILIGGDADNLMRFSKTKEVIDELKNDIASLKQAFSTWVVVPNDGGAALKAASAAWAGTALNKNIDAAKINEIKTL